MLFSVCIIYHFHCISTISYRERKRFFCCCCYISNCLLNLFFVCSILWILNSELNTIQCALSLSIAFSDFYSTWLTEIFFLSKIIFCCIFHFSVVAFFHVECVYLLFLVLVYFRKSKSMSVYVWAALKTSSIHLTNSKGKPKHEPTNVIIKYLSFWIFQQSIFSWCTLDVVDVYFLFIFAIVLVFIFFFCFSLVKMYAYFSLYQSTCNRWVFTTFIHIVVHISFSMKKCWNKN